VVNKDTYNPNTGFLTANEARNGSAILQNMTYKWDTDGTFRERSDLRANLTEEFKYDSLNRLKSSQVTGKAELRYVYDITGNLTGNIIFKANVGTYSYDSAARAHAVTSITTPGGSTRSFEYDDNGAFTIEKRNGQKYREVVWAAHEDVKEFRLSAGPRVLKVDGTELYAAGNTTTTFEYDAGFARSKKITERDRLQREITLYLGSYERITHESRASDNLSYTLNKTEHRHSIGGLALKTFTEANGTTTDETVYFLKDHLGSLTASVGSNGLVKERYSFDAWGSRRDAATWSDSTYDSFTKTTTTTRGYTGHEMLDELGIVHMNGRLYDPELGRVLSGDPIIQEPENAQNYNRYSYVINNPLSLTDPSGYSWWSKNVTKKVSKFFKNVGNAFTKAWKKTTKWLAQNEWAMIAVTIIVGVVSMGVGMMAASAVYGGSIGSLSAAFSTMGAVAAGTTTMGAAIGGAALGGITGGLVMAGAVGGAIAGGINAALGGGDLGDIFKGALIGGVQGAASAYIGHGALFSAEKLGGSAVASAIAQTVAHGILGGAVNEAMGGKFQDGFLSAAAAKGATFLPGVSDYLRATEGHGNILTSTALAATIGGTACALGGGKFANGAKTAAMQHLFNEGMGETKSFAKKLNALSRKLGGPGNPEFTDADLDILLRDQLDLNNDTRAEYSSFQEALSNTDSIFRFNGWNEKIFKFTNTGNSRYAYPKSGMYKGRDINYYAVGMRFGESGSAVFTVAGVAGYNAANGTKNIFTNGDWKNDFRQTVEAQPWARAGFSYYYKNNLMDKK
jgi:RHS repeat-associated protein